MERRTTTRTRTKDKDNRGMEETATGTGGCHSISPGGAGGPCLVGHNDEVDTGGVHWQGGDGRQEGMQTRPKH
jgi:hypothetical protein